MPGDFVRYFVTFPSGVCLVLRAWSVEQALLDAVAHGAAWPGAPRPELIEAQLGDRSVIVWRAGEVLAASVD